MSSRFLFLCALVVGVINASAAPLKFDSLKVGSKVYSNVTIVGANTTDLYFTHNNGIANVKLRYLDEKFQKQFHYDPKAAAEAEKEQTQVDTAYQEAIVSRINARAEKIAIAAKKAAITSEQSLADPISEQSLLGKPAPPLDIEKWLGRKPSLKGKFALVFFWGPWSIPCRKAIPQLNAMQKKFGEKLIFVGITPDSQDEVAEMPEPTPDFTTGLDKGTVSAAFGVTSVPHVVLIDSKGIVRYEGHPSVLDEKKIETFLPKPEE